MLSRLNTNGYLSRDCEREREREREREEIHVLSFRFYCYSNVVVSDEQLLAPVGLPRVSPGI
jgi:hypothetical protein